VRVRALAKPAAAYGSAAAISSVAAFTLLQLWRADLRVPFIYGADAPLHAAAVKSVVEHGWYLTNPNLGAPGGFEFYDYPVFSNNTVHLLAVRMMALFTGNWALVANLYFLLGFPAITLTAMAVLRRLGLGHVPAAVAAILYAFLPTRLLKNEGQLFLASFYEVPLLVLLLVWVCSEEPPFAGVMSGRTVRGNLALKSPRSRAAVAICVLSGSSSLYYSFFGACLLLMAGLWASVERRSARHLVSGLLVAGLLGTTVIANDVPTLLYQARHGRNEAAAPRLPREAETFGMRIAELLTPVRGHRLAPLAALSRAHRLEDVPTEIHTPLGLVAALGFLGLLGLLFVKRHLPRSLDDPLTCIVGLNGLAVLLATVGGFGSMMAFSGVPQIRTYARMHVFIGFFALFAVARVLQRLERRRALALAAGGAVLILGLLDQAPPAIVPQYEAVQRKYANDGDLVARIESKLPPAAIVFELPYVGFPEAEMVNSLASFDLFRPYLHSHMLRWTYPGMLGRSSDLWARNVSALAPEAMLDALVAAGAKGILIHHMGYAEKPPAIERDLGALLGAAPLLSRDRQLAFFDLSAYPLPQWLAELPAPQRERDVAIACHPIVPAMDQGCYPLEPRGQDGHFRWCGHTGAIRLRNELPYARRVVVRAVLIPAAVPAQLRLDGLVSAALDLPPAGTRLEAPIDLPAGDHEIRFQEKGPALDAPSDPRTLAWRLQDFTVDEPTSAAPGPW
jgi:phosphoglycerol transferase